MIEYTLIKSSRRTIGILVQPDGSVIVRAPLWCTGRQAEAFVREKEGWIRKAQIKLAERNAGADNAPASPFTEEELKELKKLAKKKLLPMVEELSKTVGVTYGTVSIRAQKSRWGSCSSKGNLNFNCLLMLLPENVQRYVVIHELCHRLQMNHSAVFWKEVEKYQPSYKEDRQQLKKAERGLLERLG